MIIDETSPICLFLEAAVLHYRDYGFQGCLLKSVLYALWDKQIKGQAYEVGTSKIRTALVKNINQWLKKINQWFADKKLITRLFRHKHLPFRQYTKAVIKRIFLLTI